MHRLSGLPKPILHDILSRLPREEAVRTSVLSKEWAETCSTFPILSFSDTQIIGTLPQSNEDFAMSRKIFLDYVKKTLLRFCDQGLAIKEFKLVVNCSVGLLSMSVDFDLWMKMASECGFEVLDLSLPNGPEELEEDVPGLCIFPFYYSLPRVVLETKSLTKLVLMGGVRVDEAFKNPSIKFSSLRVLSLRFVLLGDAEALKHLLSRCPLIEYITLNDCYVFEPLIIRGLLGSRASPMKSLSMLGLPKLKGVDVQGIQDVHVDAPNLENLSYCPANLNEPCRMNFYSCRNLKGLCLSSLKSTIITDNWFLKLFHKFPFLESLKLDNCTMSERVNISSDQLKILELSNCSKLKEVNIDSPNLSLCGYSGGAATKPVISFLKCSSQLEFSVLFYMDYTDLWHLREFIQNFKPLQLLTSLSLFIHQPLADVLNLDVALVSYLPPSIKHLDLRAVPEHETLYLPLINSLLSCCCPATISMSLHSFFCTRAFIEFFYKTLMSRNENGCYCCSVDSQCWWHGLKDVKVTSSVKTDENVDFKTLLDALPAFAAEETIRFMLEL